MQTFGTLNQKGGVGKTVITINLGAALAELGHRVLLIDLDPQGHLTEACSLPETTAPATLANALLMDTAALTPAHALSLVTPYRERLDVITTNLDAFTLERQLYRVRGAEYRLVRVLELLAATDRWDVCLIDCPPSLGVLTDNALVGSQHLLIPVQSEDWTLRALRLLLEQVAAVKAELRTEINILGMIVNLFDKRRGQIVTSTLDTLRTMPLEILGIIQDRTAIREAWRVGVPVIEHAPGSDSAASFRTLAKQLSA